MKAEEYLPTAIGQALDRAGFQFKGGPVPVHRGTRFPPTSAQQLYTVSALLRGPSILIAWVGDDFGFGGDAALDFGGFQTSQFEIVCRHESAEQSRAMADAILHRIVVDEVLT